MRLFNRQVFNGTAYNGTEQFTDSSFNDMLGAAETLAIQVHSSRASAGAQVRVTIYQSNDNKNWVAYGAVMDGVSLSANAVGNEFLSETPMSTSAAARGAFIRLGITMKNTSDVADLIVTVCGRTR